MDYILTFDDGSSAYLAHHGVLGMKWGVRNAETRRKYAGGNGRVGGYSSGNGRQGLTEGQKRALKTAAIGLGAAAAVGGGVYLARNKAVRKAVADHAKNIAEAKADLNEVRKSTAAAMKAEQKKFTSDWINKNARFGASQKSAKHHLRDSFKAAQKERLGLHREVGLRDINHPSYPPAKKMEDMLERYKFYKIGHEATVSGYNRQLKGRKRTINVLTAMGGATAIGTGVGAGYAYNRLSKKHAQKSRLS